MYEKDGEKYFVVDSHMHFWDASRENWVEGRENLAKGWIDCFYGYHTLAPPETHWDWDHYLKVSEDDLMKDVFEDGYVDKAIFQSTYLKYWYKDGFNTVEQNGVAAGEAPRQVHRQRALGPTGRRGRAPAARGGRPALEPQGRQALHRRVARERLPRLEADRQGVLPVPGEVPGARHHEHPRAQGPDDLAAEQGRLLHGGRRPDRDRLPGPELHHRARRHPADRRLRLHGRAGTERLRGLLGRHRRAACTPGPKSFAKFMGELLFWVGEDRLTFGSDYNIWTPKWQVEGFVDWQMPDDEAFSDYPGSRPPRRRRSSV